MDGFTGVFFVIFIFSFFLKKIKYTYNKYIIKISEKTFNIINIIKIHTVYRRV
jgi:hypothetical protein